MTSNWRQMMPTPEAYWINKILFDVQHKPDHAKRFWADPPAYMGDVPLTEHSRDLLTRNDIGGLYAAGANPYLLRAYCLQQRMPEKVYLDALRALDEDTPNG